MRGHVRKRGKKWCYVLDVGRDENGKRIRRWRSGFDRRKDAENALGEALTSLRAGAYVEPSKLTFGAYVRERWLPAVRPSLRPSTFESYQGNLRRHVEPTVGHVPLRNVTPSGLTTLYGELLTGEGEDRRPLSARTVRYVHTIVRRALADAVELELLTRNPADRAKPPSGKATRPPKPTTWTAGQLRAFLDAVREDRLYAAWRLAATTGMRRGELLGLRWPDLDEAEGRASISQTLIEGSKAPRLSEPKTDHGRRSVALDTDTVAALRAHRKAQAAEKLALGPAYEDHGLVFCREDGTPIWPRTFSRTFERLAEAAGLPRIRFHDLRHSYATLSLEAGIHPEVVRERLGHSKIAITLDIYSHARPAMQEDAAAKVAALIG